MSMNEYLSQLNGQQRDAVTYCDGPQLVIAGAGSGKTRVLTYKIVHLLENGYSPYSIMALTFTNKAANEMKTRISGLLGDSRALGLWMGTFHSVFARILRQNAERLGFSSNYTIYDTADSRSLLKTIIKEMGLKDSNYNPTLVQSIISSAKNSLITAEQYAHDPKIIREDKFKGHPALYQIYETYVSRCHIANAMDFDDLLLLTNILLRDNPDLLQRYREQFQYILVDEYQDTNFAQHNIVHMLAGGDGKVCMVGDDAQSIYSFRGANIANILNLRNFFPGIKVFMLEQNYRSTQMIVNAANSLIHKNRNQYYKEVFSKNSIGSPIEIAKCYSEFEEATKVAMRVSRIHRESNSPYREMAILYRTHAQSRIIEEFLRKYNIPYVVYGGTSFYQRKEIKDVVAYLRLITNCHDDEALKRIINVPTRGIGDVTIMKLVMAANSNSVPIWEVIKDIGDYDLKLNSGTMNKILNFRNMIAALIDLNEKGMTAGKLTQMAIHITGVLKQYQSSNTPENVSKKENIEELSNAAQQFEDERLEEGRDASLGAFLAEISLLTDQDKDVDNDDHVTLMTIHSAKGLEFDNIFICGVEDNLIPYEMSKFVQSSLEEERRLLYVAMTRARKFCMMTFAQSRMRNGVTQTMRVSPFIRDISPEFMQITDGSGRFGTTPRLTIQKTIPTPAAKITTPTQQVPATVRNTPLTETGDFCKHNADELSLNMTIRHNRFGLGIITHIDNVSEQPRITVAFEESGTKTLMLQYALFKICR